MTRPAGRVASQRFLAEGPQAVAAALVRAQSRPTSTVYEIFATASGLARFPELVDMAASINVTVTTITDQAVKALSETVTPQGVVAVCAVADASLRDVLRSAPTLVVVLAEIRDPGNAGTILRSAVAAGASAVVFAGDSVDPYNGKCVRASAGSLFHVSVVRGMSVAATIEQLRAGGLQVLATDGAGEVRLDELAENRTLAKPTAWVFGNEAHGLSDAVGTTADMRVQIPMYGQVESLNVAAAAAICLYASAGAQRRGSQAMRGRQL